MNPFYTIGHSTRAIPEFVDLLRMGDVDCVVDVRTVPRSPYPRLPRICRCSQASSPSALGVCSYTNSSGKSEERLAWRSVSAIRRAKESA